MILYFFVHYQLSSGIIQSAISRFSISSIIFRTLCFSISNTFKFLINDISSISLINSLSYKQSLFKFGNCSKPSKLSISEPFDVVQLNGIDQILWPDHCVQGTFGAELHKDLDIRPISAIFRKGMNPEIDSYSAFFDNNKLNNTGLHGFLQDKGITELVFCGLAGDFCVAYSANDAKALGYKVSLFDKGIRSIN